MNAARPRRWTPWAALVAALSGEMLHHQLLSDILRFRCEWGRPALGAWVTLAVLAWMAAGCLVARGAISPRVLAAMPPGPARNRRFIVHIGWGACALLCVAVLWQWLAVNWMPACPTP